MASIGPYHLEETLGSGGMGVVYRAVDPRDGREVAIKTLLSDRRASEASRQRTRRELEALRRLDHPHVLRVLDAGEADGPYMVLELVRGESLADRLRRGPLPLDAALRLAREQASALEHVHAAGLLHRDLKPANVLLREDGSSCLTDFGLTLEVEATRSRLTKTGQLLGTPGFWAPEQAQGDPHACSPATDVYGFGALLYAALTGRPP
ncbi:MAG: serine/threonine protein kinase, partial [Planctomycetes bacterium]|nr:serine/threonine protein kinase [Planctomycetota bacterium]